MQRKHPLSKSKFATLCVALIALVLCVGMHVSAEDETGMGSTLSQCRASGGDPDKFLSALPDAPQTIPRDVDASFTIAYAKFFCAGWLSDNNRNGAERMLASARSDVARSRHPEAQFLLPQFDLAQANFAFGDGNFSKAEQFAKRALDEAQANQRVLEKYRAQMEQERKSNEESEPLDDDEGRSSSEDDEGGEQQRYDFELQARSTLANIYIYEGAWAKAEGEAGRAEALANHLPSQLRVLTLPSAQIAHAVALEGENRYSEALVLARAGIQGFAHPDIPGEATDRSALSTLSSLIRSLPGDQSYIYDAYVEALLAVNLQQPTPALRTELFDGVQAMHESKFGDIAQSLTAKLESGSDELGTLLRERENAIGELRNAISGGMSSLMGMMIEQPGANNLAEATSRISNVDRTIDEKFSAYRDYLDPQPVALSDVQTVLRQNEHVVFYFSAFRSLSALVVGKTGEPLLVRLATTPADVTRQVSLLRASLTSPARGSGAAFASDVALQLYQSVFARIANTIPKGDQVLLVPEGALASLPFETLLVDKPSDLSDRGLASAHWLGNDYRFATLPSLAALRALRRAAASSRSTKPFLGLGDPLLPAATDGDGRDYRSSAPFGDATRLPGAAPELAAMASLFNAGPDALYTGARFAKPVLHELDVTGVLKNVRILAIASHTGWITTMPPPSPGDQEMGFRAPAPRAEPVIVLTPPRMPSSDDDGHWSLADIARLSLDADWIILSACDTAAPDGSPNGIPLTGFARAFLHAKARALLVSHWEVNDRAAAALTVSVLTAYRQSHSRSAALAAGEEAVRSMPGFGHPYYWAPFVVVGEPLGS